MIAVFAFFLIAVQAVLALGHFLIYETAAFFLPFTPRGLFYFRWVLSVVSFYFLAASLLSFRWFNRFTVWFYRGAALWLGTLHFLLLACAAIWLVEAVYLSFGLLMPGFVAGLFFAAGLIGSASGLWWSFKTKVVRYDAVLKNLPPNWKGKKIVLFSDTHFGSVRNLGTAKKYLRLIKEQNPDMVLMAGDFYDGTKTNAAELAQVFSALTPPLGKYFADGNHEEFGNRELYAKALEAAGFTVLNDKKTEVDGVQILGIVFKDSSSSHHVAEKLKQLEIDRGRPSILIKHAPFTLAASEAAGISLEVSGHTHLGQVWPFNYVTRAVFKGYDHGAKMYGGMLQITSSGAGTWGPPHRLGSQSEIVVITLK